MRAAVVVFACAIAVALAGAAGCSSPPERGTSGKPIAGTSPAEVLGAASASVQKDTRLTAALAPRAAGHGWAAGNASEGFVMAETKTAAESYRGLDAKLGASARDGLRIEPRGFDDLAVVLHPEGASDVAGTLSDGRVVFPRAFGPAVDRVVTASPAVVEELLVLRDASAPTTFAWTVDLPRGIARVVPDHRGGLDFQSAAGKTTLHLAAPYAIDGAGETHAATVRWDAERRRMSVHLDTTSLPFRCCSIRRWNTARGSW